jgi:hypothetical protein
MNEETLLDLRRRGDGDEDVDDDDYNDGKIKEISRNEMHSTAAKATRMQSTPREREVKQIRRLAAKDTLRLHRTKVFFCICIVAAAVGAAYSTYFFLDQDERRKYENSVRFFFHLIHHIAFRIDYSLYH